MKQGSGRKVRRFTVEFKSDAVAMVEVEGLRIAEAARRLGVARSTLATWVRMARVSRGACRCPLTPERSDQAELTRLRSENARLRGDRELLKQAMAFWVREPEP